MLVGKCQHKERILVAVLVSPFGGRYYQSIDSVSWTDDRAHNPDDLILWNDYISHGDCTDCRGFEAWGQLKPRDQACMSPGGPECEFTWNRDDLTDEGHIPGLAPDEVADTSTIDDSIDATDLKSARWAHHGLAAPMDKFDMLEIDTFWEAQCVT